MTAETITPNDEDVAACDHQRQLDHIDQMCHDVLRMLAELEPLLPLIPRALALLDPGAAMRRSFGRRGRTDAVQERTPAPFHVGQAPEDRPPLGA